MSSLDRQIWRGLRRGVEWTAAWDDGIENHLSGRERVGVLVERDERAGRDAVAERVIHEPERCNALRRPDVVAAAVGASHSELCQARRGGRIDVEPPLLPTR